MSVAMLKTTGGWLGGGVCFFIMAIVLLNPPAVRADDWLTHGGGGVENRRWAREEGCISPRTAPSLSAKWRVNTTGDVTATPAIYKGVIYFPDWNGSVFAVNQSTGNVIWRTTLQSYGFPAGVLSRQTPVVVGDLLVLGTSGPAFVIRISSKDGSLMWAKQIDAHPAAILTGSGTALKGAYYTGVSSAEEFFAQLPTYKCCNFIGSAVKLDLTNGSIIWKTFVLPPNNNRPDLYSGAALWGASPPIDEKRGAVYFATGNNYNVPQNVSDCHQRWLANPVGPNTCDDPDNRFNSIIAFNIYSGKIIWSRRLSQFDAWNGACLLQPLGINCPLGFGPDADFGLNPAMVTITPPGSRKKLDVLIAGQKSGIVWTLNRDTGEVVWSSSAGPGGDAGGISWGIAVDSKRIYVGIQNSQNKNFTLLPGQKVTNGGGWVALDLNSGKVLWSTANPIIEKFQRSYGMLTTVANGVVFGGSPDPEGYVFAMNAKDGTILNTFTAGATVYGGVSVDNGCAFFGRGYVRSKSSGFSGGGIQNVIALCTRNPCKY